MFKKQTSIQYSIDRHTVYLWYFGMHLNVLTMFSTFSVLIRAKFLKTSVKNVQTRQNNGLKFHVFASMKKSKGIPTWDLNPF